jgi:hypothetical protein
MPKFTKEASSLANNWAKGWTTSEIKYLCENYYSLGAEAVALALGRSLSAVTTRVYMLTKQNKLIPPEQRRRVYLNKIYSNRKTDYRLHLNLKGNRNGHK